MEGGKWGGNWLSSYSDVQHGALDDDEVVIAERAVEDAVEHSRREQPRVVLEAQSKALD